METIYLDGFISPITVGENQKLLAALQQGNLGHLISVKGKLAKVTAVYDSNGIVYMLSLKGSEIGGSILVEDKSDEPVPRAPQFFRSPLLKAEQYGSILGVAAYKFIQSPQVVSQHATRASEAVN